MRKHLILTFLTLIFILLACNAVSAVDTNTNNDVQIIAQTSGVTADPTPNVVITGEVTKCSNGDPFPGVTVTAQDNGTELASTTTQEDGTYNMSFQSNNSVFNVTASYPGHEPVSKEVTVSPDQNKVNYGAADFKLGQDNVYVSPLGDDDDQAHGGLNPKPYKTLAKAISVVNPNGTIWMDNGIYTGNGNVDLTIDKNITIKNWHEQYGPLIDGKTIDNGNSVYHTIFTVNSGTLMLSGICITEAETAVDNSLNTVINIDYCKFTNNKSSNGYGGAIYNFGGEVYVSNSNFDSNTADVSGGAICSHGYLTVSQCTFTNNIAEQGGAISGSTLGGQGWMNISQCTFSGNKATHPNFKYGGGAILALCGCTITNCTFDQNTAACDGAAIYINANANVINCTFTNNQSESGAIWTTTNSNTNIYYDPTKQGNSSFANNHATNYGGAIENYGAITIKDTNFTGNTSGNDGGAISNYGKLNISNSKFTGNRAVNNAGAIWNNINPSYTHHGPLTITNSIFTGNSATRGSVIDNERSDTSSDPVNINFNIISGNTGNNDIYSASENINAEDNWWGSNFEGTNPQDAGRVNSNVDASPWIILTVTAHMTALGGNSTITADLLNDNSNKPAGGMVPDGQTVTFTNLSGWGTITPPTSLTANGKAEATYNANGSPPYPSSVQIKTNVDNENIITTIILDGSPPQVTITSPNDGAFVKNIITITATATDDTGVTQVTFQIKDSNNQVVSTGTGISGPNGWTYDWDGTNFNGQYTITTMASDAVGNIGYSSITVNDVNRAPVLGSIADRSTDENQLLTFTVSGTDPDNDSITYSATGSNGSPLPVGASINAQSGLFSWTPTFSQSGTYPVTFTVIDSGGLFDSKTVNINVNNVNRAPNLNSVGDKVVNENQLLSFTLAGSDPDAGEVLTYSTTGLPSGATLNLNTGVFSWTPSFSQSGTYKVTFTVTDAGGLSDSKTANIVVNNVNIADLQVKVVSSDSMPAVDRKFAFMVYIKNNGPNDATNVTVNVPIPAGLTYNYYISTQGTYNGSVWTLGKIKSGSRVFLYICATPQTSYVGKSFTLTATPTLKEYDPTPVPGSTTIKISRISRMALVLFSVFMLYEIFQS